MNEISMPRNQPERCGDCGRRLTWIEVAFGRYNDPVCGACLAERPDYQELKARMKWGEEIVEAFKDGK